MFCRFCGREISGNPQYCPWCGQKLDEGSGQSGAEQNTYSDNNAQNEKGNWRSYITPENIERYAPVAALVPVVLILLGVINRILLNLCMRPVSMILSQFGIYMGYWPVGLLFRFIAIILSILVLAATAGLVYVAVKKKETTYVLVWVAPAATLLAFISCCGILFRPSVVWYILGIVCCVIGLEMIARITFSGQLMESPVNFQAAFATYKTAYEDYKSKYPTTKDLERTEIISSNTENSYFDGSGFELLGYVLLTVLVSGITCGIAAPWMICQIYRWKLSHTVINGRRFTFDGTGAGLLGHWIIWEILTVITCGIYAFFAHVALRKWELSHTYIDGEPVVPGSKVSYFDGNSFQYFGYGLLGGLFIVVTCGLATPWVVCMLQKWDTKHQVVNAHRLVFSGSGLGFLGEYIIIALLTLITCGIYLPWGVVRQNKYIIRHTDFI